VNEPQMNIVILTSKGFVCHCAGFPVTSCAHAKKAIEWADENGHEYQQIKTDLSGN